MPRPFALLVLALAATPGPGQPPPIGAATPWAFDEVRVANGHTFRGVILAEKPAGMSFQVVIRKPGRPTYTLTTVFGPREIAHVKRLTAADRAALTGRLEALDLKGHGERRRMADLTLAPADWPGTPAGAGGATRYESDRFVLVSAAADDVTRQAADRLEQIYAAYARFLPPRLPADRPTTVYLAATASDYRAALGPAAGPVHNPAVYDPIRNRIVCGSDLKRLSDTLAEVRAGHARERKKLDQAEADLRQFYKGAKADLDRFLPSLGGERERLRLADQANDAAFEKATHQLFALLYHEAFHSYVATAVYPPKAAGGPGELPRWLNEGLAQIFETAVLDAGELRVGHADPIRLDRVQALLKPSAAGLVPLADLLRSSRPAFLAVHADQQAATDRAYLTAWALTFYLTFDRRRVGAEDFPGYLSAVNDGADPVAAFEAWAGQPGAAFEREFHDFMRRLRPDGTLVPRVVRK